MAAMRLLYRACILTEKTLLAAMASEWTVTGKENVPRSGRLIVVANHLSYADPSMVATALPRPVRFLAKDTLFEHPISRWFLTTYGAHPLRRGSMDVRAYRWARRILESDRALVLFPEGTRGDGGLGPGQPGVARLALATGSPLLPVSVTGTAHMGPWWRVLCPSGRIRVRIGEPFRLPAPDGPPSRETLTDLTDRIMLSIAALLPESYRGAYAKARGGSG